eukprot:10012790-Lingulodinium_polyedra.AAC.1
MGPRARVCTQTLVRDTRSRLRAPARLSSGKELENNAGRGALRGPTLAGRQTATTTTTVATPTTTMS